MPIWLLHVQYWISFIEVNSCSFKVLRRGKWDSVDNGNVIKNEFFSYVQYKSEKTITFPLYVVSILWRRNSTLRCSPDEGITNDDTPKPAVNFVRLDHFILTVLATLLFCKVRTHWKCFSLPVFVSKYLISHTIKTFSQLVDIVYHQLFQNGMVCWFWCHFTWVQLICCSRYLNRQAPAVPDVQRVNQFMIAGWRNHASDILYTPPSPISLPLSTNPSLGLAQLQ